MKVETIKCDVCGRVKGDANKWIAVIEHLGAMTVATRSYFEEHAATYPQRCVEDICSTTCLYKRVGQLLSSIHPVSETTSSSDEHHE